MKKISLLILSFITIQISSAQDNKPPKLIVGVVVDQMRADYIHRFESNFTENGFKRLLREGFQVKNMHYNYVPTATGPGHASVYTGTTPAKHGIVGNYWYNRANSSSIYCAEDNAVELIGQTEKKPKYARSPKNLKASTITDQLKLLSPQSKVIGMSLKDRGAILPAGHKADYAFWYHSQSGDFISSSYYGNTIPAWLSKFNQRKLADSLLNLRWDFFLEQNKYSHSEADDSPFEKIFEGKKTSTFPYDLKKLRAKNGNFGMLAQVPFGNNILTDLAVTAMDAEKMGKDEVTDFIAISYSSTDYIGHNFGIRSKEIEDTYVRLDRDIEKLLNYLDQKVGKGNYLLFLTADHGASETPIHLEKNHLPNGFFKASVIKEKLNEHLSKTFGGNDYIAYIDKTQIYLKEEIRYDQKILGSIQHFLITQIEEMKTVYLPNLVDKQPIQEEMKRIFLNSVHQFSGDVIMHFKEGWMGKRDYGTTHGNAYNGDTHVPCLWFGKGVQQGSTSKFYTIDQIVPTISFMTGISLPESANKNAIRGLVK